MENQNNTYVIITILVITFFLIKLSRRFIKRRRINLIRKEIYLEEKRRENFIKSVTELDRGTESERSLIFSLIESGISSQALFHDLYIKTSLNRFSQIDLVLATKVGIIVFEVKEYSGWIFGNGKSSHWMQVLAYGKDKYRFYNPINQNKQHIESLRKKSSQFNSLPYYSVIVFYGDCKLKEIDFIPKNTYVVKAHRVLEVIDLIQKENLPAQYTNKHEVVDILKEAVANGNNKDNQIAHIETINDMLGYHRLFD